MLNFAIDPVQKNSSLFLDCETVKEKVKMKQKIFKLYIYMRMLALKIGTAQH
jgi:hypothetical protein